MTIRPLQAVANFRAKIAYAGVRSGLVNLDARVECCVDEIADRVDGNRHGCSQEPDESAADCWSESLSSGVCLIEPCIGRNQSRSGYQARKQRLGRGEPENGECPEQQQGEDQNPDLQYPHQPQDRDCTQGESTSDTRPHKNRFATPPIGVCAGGEPEERIGCRVADYLT